MTPCPDSTEATPAYMLEEKIKLNRLTELYKYLGVKGDPNLANLGEIWVKKIKKNKKNPKTSNTDLLFLDAKNKWIYLTKQGSGFYVVKTLRGIFDILSKETPPALDRSIKEATKLNSSIVLQIGDIPMVELPEKAKET